MSTTKQAKAALTGAEPQLFVTDLAASLALYRDKLGFEIVFQYGEPPFYAQVARDAVRLNLRHVDRSVIDAATRDREDLLAATLALDNAEALKSLFLEFQAAGAAFHQTLKIEPWGAKSFIVKDQDGNLLLFAAAEE